MIYADGLPVTYDVDTIRFNAIDPDGAQWIVQKTEGWHGPVQMRTARDPRPTADGDFRSTSLRAGRTVTLTGLCWCPDVDTRIKAADRFAALCWDGGRLYDLVVTDQTGRARTAAVELDGDPDTELVNERRFNFQVSFAAPDPRKHDYVWQEPIATLPQPMFGGLDPLAGLDPAAGLDAGNPLSNFAPSVAKVGNYGTAPIYPLFRVRGPCSPFTIVDLERGWRMPYTEPVSAGEDLLVNCDRFAQRGVRGHAVISTLRGNVAPLMRRSVDWPRIDPQATGRYQLEAAAGSGELKASVRSAWH